ncbi:hypothetical protein [Mycobacterium montefiorense]|uniref:Uncharacterized protein n=1 Tax=Mycobacterium montefiorense TaxID=154654 RepID=A0AA37UUK4_9MYCO|nr:hypothetical protein [Mycobacterium montefiorense]GBG40523.1 hypothetical protein MmonteBS_48950 [Mycobacterium montefiorense]GKU36378.1 hypothetical protein NJB14191_37240 [Mycobacterium montefiorense]GKU39308.1 hypothetical protein NJB14192_13030 [Mycobacterium montefiorense]GKU44703.1 hypothetical protein NJB14194_13290 [Mycobacterium montefiorense]GKU54089.1 hypothetical protein NJB14195_53300 [Mycobacterium montefiorense]
MRFLAILQLWLITTAALALAVPSMWAQCNLVDENGYVALARKAAADPALQSAMAGELTTRTMALIAERGGGHYPLDSSQVHDAAAEFTAGPSFPPLFATANRAAHRWLFADVGSGDSWAIDVAPMLNDSAFAQILSEHNVTVPATLTVPLTASVPHALRQGELSRVAAWGKWASLGVAGLCGVCALLTLLAARRRGKALTSLGVSALLVGATGWVGIEVAGRYLNEVLNRTTGDIRQIADVMVRSVESGLRDWLTLTLAAGAALVVCGVIVAVLGSLVKKV